MNFENDIVLISNTGPVKAVTLCRVASSIEDRSEVDSAGDVAS